MLAEVPLAGLSFSGTASLLAAGGVTINAPFYVAAPGAGSSQVAVLGATSGTGNSSSFGNVAIYVGRDLTLQAATGVTATFNTFWKDLSGSAAPAVGFTIGSADNTGTVVLGSSLSAATFVNVVAGTARLSGANNRINTATAVTVGAGLGPATLEIDGRSQTLSNLTFAGNSGSITGGTLRLDGASAVGVSGTGHVISSLVALDADKTFATESASRLTMSNAISGGFGLTKSGLGILELSGTNAYTGPTTVAAGGAARERLEFGRQPGGSGGWIGGLGSLAGGLALSGSGAGLVFGPTGPLTVSGSVSIDNLFGVSSLVAADGGAIDWDLIATGTYTLISNTTTTFGGFNNFGSGNATPIGSIALNRSAYFQNGSLQLVIVPEPATLALAALGLAAAWAIRRRGRSAACPAGCRAADLEIPHRERKPRPHARKNVVDISVIARRLYV
jgi:autotransporter-associated beta strand protein